MLHTMSQTHWPFDFRDEFKGLLPCMGVVDKNRADTVDISARVQMGRRIIYVMMDAGANGSTGVAWTVIAHLWKVFALPRMLYGMYSSGSHARNGLLY